MMNRTKAALLLIVLACVSLLGVGLYLQIVLDMLPCPLCVMQRYAFLLIALCCLLALMFSKHHHKLVGSGIFFGLFGAGVAGYQVWVLTQPPGSCGVDPILGPLNSFFMAKLFPTLLQANGLCDTPYDPILGLSIPAWAVVWFVALTITLLMLYVGNKKERVFFGKIRK